MESQTETQKTEKLVEWIANLDSSSPLEMRQLIAAEVQTQIKAFASNVLYYKNPVHFRHLADLVRDTVLAIVKTIDPYLPPVLEK